MKKIFIIKTIRSSNDIWNKYYKDAKSKGMAKIITAKINMKEELNEIRNIYREIKKFHNQNL